ncbi:MAG TPA: ion channel, partial [Xanthomonadaceae bacterium]|nr:ion channel [Xanthomonadaceae bacterium]
VGFGDIAPHTALGQFVTSILILIGYGIIAVPTGIYTAELANTLREKGSSRRCESCGHERHDAEAEFCSRCGGSLNST